MRNADKVRMWNKLRIHRQRGGGPTPEPIDLGAMLCEQEGLCPYCGCVLGDGAHLDHKTPLSRGGTNDESNLQWTCAACNLEKRAKTHEEYVAYRAERMHMVLRG